MRSEGYNGWTNYETWSVNLIISNDHGLYLEVCDLLAQIRDDVASTGHDVWTPEEHRLFASADALKDYVETFATEAMDEMTGPWSGLVRQLFGGALDDVDWNEIAASWIEADR